MEQGAGAEPQDRQPGLTKTGVRRVLGLTRPYRAQLVGAGLLMLVSTGLSLSVPLVARHTLDNVLRTHQAANLNGLTVALLGLTLLGAALKYTQSLLVAGAANRMVRDLRGRLFAHLLELPVAYFDHVRSGAMASHIANDVSVLQQTLTDDLVRLASYLFTLAGGVALTFMIDWRLSAAVLALLTGMLACCLMAGRRLRGLTRQSLDALSQTIGAMTETLSNLRLVKAFGREEHEAGRARADLDRVYAVSMQSSVLEAALSSAVYAGFAVVLLGVLRIEGSRVVDGSLSAGSVVAFMMTLLIMASPMGSLASQYGRWQRGVGAADRLFAVLDEAAEPEDAPDAAEFPAGPGRISFQDIGFAYVPSSPVLRGLTLEAPAGWVTAVAGASGAGKTTLALLLYRFYTPQAGTIAIDGVPISEIRRSALRENIGVVPQEPALFSGTIRENIRYGRLTATDNEVERAAQAANVAEFAESLAQGYETVLGERGVTLSGGQRQRIAIARAMLKDPRILILDEATSALDTHSERLVREALERLMRGRTTLVIAHRLSTIQNADQIAVLDAGVVAEQGTHAELLSRGGRYAALHEVSNSAAGTFAYALAVTGRPESEGPPLGGPGPRGGQSSANGSDSSTGDAAASLAGESVSTTASSFRPASRLSTEV